MPHARGHNVPPAVRLRRAEEIEALGFSVVADMNRESHAQRPNVRHRTVTARAQRAQQMRAERAERQERTRTERAERSGRPTNPELPRRTLSILG